jgi:superfamily II DNA or RNA helicase
MGTMPQDAKGCAGYVAKCRNTSGVRDLLFARLVSFGDQDRLQDDDALADGFVPRFGTVTPSKQAPQAHSSYPHQEAAWKELDGHLRDAQTSGIFKGVLVMPTGSGKTETAVSWLLRQWVAGDKRVLWLAHREELLRQAARAFYQLSGLLARTAHKPLRIRIVSTRHCRFHQIDSADDIVCCSVNSLARAGDEAKRLLGDKNLFVVIDEALLWRRAFGSWRDALAHR